MAIRIFKTKPLFNKTNKQISICLPKKKMDIPKDKIPKEIKLKIEEIIWE